MSNVFGRYCYEAGRGNACATLGGKKPTQGWVYGESHKRSLCPLRTSLSVSSFLLFCLGFTSLSASAISYGIYDSRAAGMGGVGVAAGNYENAIFYNPALLSFHDEKEDESRDGRFFFPMATAQYYEDAVQTLKDVEDLQIEDQLEAAVAAYNADPVAGASQVSAAVTEFESAALVVGNRDYNGEAFAGMLVSEPSEREGGSFYLGTRLVVGGRADVTDEDLAILQDYQDMMAIVGSGGTPGPEYDYLIDEDGNLIDPSEGVTSRYDVGAVGITEVGLALSKEFNIYGFDIAFGFTPKAKRTDVYREERAVTDTDIESLDSAIAHYNFNFDIGVAAEFYENYRVALAVKDLVPESFSYSDTSPNIEMRPRSRLGLAYTNSWIMVGMDVDLVENTPIAGESPSKDLGLGLEVNPFGTFDLRLGYKHDLMGIHTDVLTGGIGWSIGFFAIEAAYMQSDEMQGGALQLGITF